MWRRVAVPCPIGARAPTLMMQMRAASEPQPAGGDHPGGAGTPPSSSLVQDLAAIAAEDAASVVSWCARLICGLPSMLFYAFTDTTSNNPCQICAVRFWLVVALGCFAVFCAFVEKIFCPPRPPQPLDAKEPRSPSSPIQRPCVSNAIWGMIAAAVLLVLISRLVEYVRWRRREYRERLARDMEMQGPQQGVHTGVQAHGADAA